MAELGSFFGTARSEQAKFEGSLGDTLSARLDLPDAPPRAWALFAHCFTCGKDSIAASRVAGALARLGVATMRFDFTGLGSSDGDFANTSFASNLEDLRKAVDWLRATHEAPQLLIGHSLGGAAVLAVAGDIPECRAVATIGAPADPGHVVHLFGEKLDEIEEKGEAEVKLGGRPFRIRRGFLEDVRSQDLAERIRNLGKALLICHAPTDNYVGVENAAEIFKLAKHPKSYLSLDDAHHLVLRREDALYLANLIAQWAARYLHLPEADMARVPSSTLPPDVVEVQESMKTKFHQTIRSGPHVLLADEPESVPGGRDAGPGPYAYLRMALGTCTSMTLRHYASLKHLSLGRIRVWVRHSKRDLPSGAKQDVFDRTITLEGDLTPAERAKLLEIADKCPVHRTLTSDVCVRTQLQKEPPGTPETPGAAAPSAAAFDSKVAS